MCVLEHTRMQQDEKLLFIQTHYRILALPRAAPNRDGKEIHSTPLHVRGIRRVSICVKQNLLTSWYFLYNIQMHGRKLALYTEAGPNRLALYTDRLLNPYIQRQGHTGSLCIYTYIYRCFGNSNKSAYDKKWFICRNIFLMSWYLCMHLYTDTHLQRMLQFASQSYGSKGSSRLSLCRSCGIAHDHGARKAMQKAAQMQQHIHR